LNFGKKSFWRTVEEMIALHYPIRETATAFLHWDANMRLAYSEMPVDSDTPSDFFGF
jgi:hypothetical protein